MLRKDDSTIDPITGKKINRIMQENLSFFELKISTNNKILKTIYLILEIII
jgi:hypothetical protein